MVDDLRTRVPLGLGGRVLDLACGTGQVAFALAAHAREVVAVDQEPGFVELGERKASSLRVGNVRWVVAAAEGVRLDGDFDLVAIGNAFHRLHRETVARRLVSHLRPRGCVALLWGDPPPRGDRAWQGLLDETLVRWTDRVGARDRVPAGWEQAIARDPHEAVLRRVGPAYEGAFEFSAHQRWSVDALVGFAYSTSFLSRTALGRHAPEFEADVRRRLLACQDDGAFEQDVSYAYQLARRHDPDGRSPVDHAEVVALGIAHRRVVGELLPPTSRWSGVMPRGVWPCAARRAIGTDLEPVQHRRPQPRQPGRVAAVDDDLRQPGHHGAGLWARR